MTHLVRRVAGAVWETTRQVVIRSLSFAPGFLLHRRVDPNEPIGWDPEVDRRKDQPDLP